MWTAVPLRAILFLAERYVYRTKLQEVASMEKYLVDQPPKTWDNCTEELRGLLKMNYNEKSDALFYKVERLTTLMDEDYGTKFGLSISCFDPCAPENCSYGGTVCCTPSTQFSCELSDSNAYLYSFRREGKEVTQEDILRLLDEEETRANQSK